VLVVLLEHCYNSASLFIWLQILLISSIILIIIHHHHQQQQHQRIIHCNNNDSNHNNVIKVDGLRTASLIKIFLYSSRHYSRKKIYFACLLVGKTNFLARQPFCEYIADVVVSKTPESSTTNNGSRSQTETY
jgi:hypothetical protein